MLPSPAAPTIQPSMMYRFTLNAGEYITSAHMCGNALGVGNCYNSKSCNVLTGIQVRSQYIHSAAWSVHTMHPYFLDLDPSKTTLYPASFPCQICVPSSVCSSQPTPVRSPRLAPCHPAARIHQAGGPTATITMRLGLLRRPGRNSSTSSVRAVPSFRTCALPGMCCPEKFVFGVFCWSRHLLFRFRCILLVSTFIVEPLVEP